MYYFKIETNTLLNKSRQDIKDNKTTRQQDNKTTRQQDNNG